VYDFGNPNASPPTLQAVGSSSYAVTHSGITLTACGYNTSVTPNTLKLLEWKAGTGDEHGLGFTDTNDNEITLNSQDQPANYIQVNVTQALTAGGTNGMIKAGSVTNGEAFDVWGSNTKGTLGTLLTPSGSTADQTFIPIPHWGSYNYIAMTVHPESVWGDDGLTMQPDCSYNDNVLLSAVEFCQVPEPASLTLLALGGLTLLRRRR
jgi:MYXO-CTERM domain-containing protein